MKSSISLLATLALSTSLNVFAGESFPVCYQMQDDPLSRMYVVAEHNNDPMAALASQSRRGVRLYEYHVEPSYPADQRLTLQATMFGVASLNNGMIDRVNAGTVTGMDIGTNAVYTAEIAENWQEGGWQVRRSTFNGSVTSHNVERVECSSVLN